MPARDIEALDCELAVYRKGFLSVHINLERGYFTWRESNCWTNNFTRSLRPDQIEQLRQNLSQCLSILMMPETTESESAQQMDQLGTSTADQPGRTSMTWSLGLKTAAGYRHSTAVDEASLPADWKILKQTIESLSRLPFALR